MKHGSFIQHARRKVGHDAPFDVDVYLTSAIAIFSRYRLDPSSSPSKKPFRVNPSANRFHVSGLMALRKSPLVRLLHLSADAWPTRNRHASSGGIKTTEVPSMAFACVQGVAQATGMFRQSALRQHVPGVRNVRVGRQQTIALGLMTMHIPGRLPPAQWRAFVRAAQLSRGRQARPYFLQDPTYRRFTRHVDRTHSASSQKQKKNYVQRRTEAHERRVCRRQPSLFIRSPVIELSDPRENR